MSSACIVMPLDWDALVKTFIPAWIDTIEGRISVAEFASRYIRYPEELGFPEGEPISGVLEADKSYLSSIGWSMFEIPFPTEKVRKSATHQQLDNAGHIIFSNNLMTEALVQSLYHPIALRMSEKPGIERLWGKSDYPVSWTRNSFGFLADLYEKTWEKEDHEYCYRSKSMAPPDLVSLLNDLFLGERTFPALTIRPHRFGYPATDGGPWLLGYLSPEQTRQLSGAMAAAKQAFPTWDDDELYHALECVIHGSADAGAGLVCVYGDRKLSS